MMKEMMDYDDGKTPDVGLDFTRGQKDTKVVEAF